MTRDPGDFFLQTEEEAIAGNDWIYGVQPVLEALQSDRRRIEKIWVAYGRAGAGVGKILSMARSSNIPVSRRDRSTLEEKSGTSKNQGVLALCSLVDRVPLHDFMEGLSKDSPRFLVLLDGIQDPQNLGAVIRSACATGVEGILLPERRICPVTPVVAKASAGALEHVPLVEAGNASESLRELRDRGVFVIGADAGGERGMYEMDLQGDICVVLGGEGKGLRPGLRKQCDHLVSLPMLGPVASLNVSVASAVIFYEIVRQRRFS